MDIINNNKFKFIFWIILFETSCCIAQINSEKKTRLGPDKIILGGIIIDSVSHKAVSYYKFDVYDKQKQTKINTFLTDKDGLFSVSVDRFSKIILLKPFEIQQANPIILNLSDSIKPDSIIDIGQLFLNISSISLKEVLIKGNLKANLLTRIYSVKELKTAESPIVRNFLKTLPGITVQNEELLIDGRKKPKFYINGLEVSAEAVNNIPLEAVSKVEIIPIPSLSKGLTINEGIINVITKHTSSILLGGQLTWGQGIIRNTNNETVNLFQNSKKTFVNLSMNSYSNNYTASNSAEWFNNNVLIFSEQSDARYKIRPLFSSLTLKHKISNSVTLNTMIRYGYQKIDYVDSWILNQPNFINEQELGNTFYNKLNYSWINNTEISYKNSDRSIFYFNITNSHSKNDNSILNSRINTGDTKTISNSLTGNLAFQLREELTLDKITIENGLIFSRLKNRVSFHQDSDDILNTGFSKYNTEIYSGFFNISIPIIKGIFMIGSKIDYNSYDLGEDITIDKPKAYTFTPALTYMLPTKTNGSFIFNFQRYINLPGIENINSARISFKPNNYNFGNNNLQPEIINSFEFYNTRDFSDKNLIIDLYYNKTKRLIEYSGFEYNQIDNSLTRQYLNLGSEQKVGCNISLVSPLFKKITLNSNIRFEYYDYDLQTLDNNILTTFRKNGKLIQLSADISYVVNETLSANLNGTYQNVNYLPFLNQYQKSPDISIELNQSIHKGRINLSLAWSSLSNWGNSMRENYTSLYNSGIMHETLHSQNLIFSLSYHFGKQISNKNVSPKPIETRKVKQPQGIL